MKPIPLIALLGLAAGPAIAQVAAQGHPWKLVWSDDFSQEGHPDPAKWTYEHGFVRNHEQQYYTTDRLENARVEGGNLIVEARPESYQGATFTSASLTTKGKWVWKYGKIEIRAQLPVARGAWPALWMLGDDHDRRGWPRCGEIDIMELVGFKPDEINGNVHNPARYDPAVPSAQRGKFGARTRLEHPEAGFHVYGIEWDRDAITFAVDGQGYFTYHNLHRGEGQWPFDHPFYLILNLAVGGTWGGQHGVDTAAFPQEMKVDYVRVYQRS